MDVDRWRRIEELFAEAADTEESARDALLRARCGDDGDLLQEVNRLLAADRKAASRLAAAVGGSVRSFSASLASGQRIGQYEIVGLIGQGGMGRVYHARRNDDVFSKDVAIKVVNHPSDAFVRRFQRERRILARLEHPSIARVIDGGSTDEGLPYLVMEYVEGRNAIDYASEQQLDLAARLRLFLQVCEAVDHAHQNQVVHRDLKPGNILVDKQGRPRLLDFGIAKLMDAEDRTATGTAGGHGLLTPRYSSPEQVKGEPVTPVSDVYSLGLLLFELLTGCAAHQLSGDSPMAIVRAVCDEDIRPPSHAARTALERGSPVPVPPEQLTSQLDRIVLTAVEKDPGRRYASVQALAADIRSYLESGTAAQVQLKPFASRPFARRRTAAAASVVAAMVLGGAAYLMWSPRAPAAGGKIMLAVLPLENLTGSEDQDFFVDGLHEEMISRLSRLRPDRLGVIARTSVLQYKKSRKSIAEIGDALGVSYVLESSVRQAADQLRVTVTFIQVSDQTQLWAQTYQRQYRDLFQLQAEVASRVADSLELGVFPEALAITERNSQLTPEFHVAYLRGRYFWQRRTLLDPAMVQRAQEYFQQVVAGAPEFAEGHSSLGRLYTFLAMYAEAGQKQAFRAKAEEEFTRALALNPQLAAAHAALATARFQFDWDWQGAEEAYREALRLNANLADIHQGLAALLAFTGRHQEADHQTRLAQELDPVSPTLYESVFYVHLAARRWEKAEAAINKIADLTAAFPKNSYVIALRALLLALRENCQAAMVEFATLASPFSDLEASPTGYAPAFVFGRCGTPEEVRARARRMEEQSKPYAHTIAVLYAGLGDRERALRWLEEAYRRHEATVNYAAVDPTLDVLRNEPRFTALLENLGLPVVQH